MIKFILLAAMILNNTSNAGQMEEELPMTWVYVSDHSNNLWQCPIDPATGGFISSACIALTNSTPPGFLTTSGIAFNSFGGITYAYVTDQSSTLWQCAMDPITGGFSPSTCTALNSSGFNSPISVTFHTFAGITYAYVADISSNLWQCPIDPSTGGFSSACIALTNSTGPGFLATISVAFKTFAGTTYAYVTDDSSNLWQCPINPITGGFSSSACAALTNSTAPGFNLTVATTFYTFSGTTYAYVTDTSSNLWQCQMNPATGGFSPSECTALTNSTGPGFSQTITATFNTFAGTTYAYVTDASSNLWQCQMNPATGGFSSSACTQLTNSTAPGFFLTSDAEFNLSPPSLSKSFSPSFIHVNGQTTLTINLGNTNSSDFTLSSDFTDTLDSHLSIVGTPTTSCTGTGTFFTVVGNTLTLLASANATIPAGGCTITATVTAAVAGTFPNTTSTLSVNGVSLIIGPATARLSVLLSPCKIKGLCKTQQ